MAQNKIRSGTKGVSVTGEDLWDLFDVTRQVTQRQREELVRYSIVLALMF